MQSDEFQGRYAGFLADGKDGSAKKPVGPDHGERYTDRSLYSHLTVMMEGSAP